MEEVNPYRSPELQRPEPSQSGDGSASASGSPFVQYFQPPRLRILHLIGWMTAAAVVIRADMVFQAARADAGAATGQPLELVQRFFWSAVVAAIIVGGGILAIGWMRGIKGRLQPGHWLIVVNALGLVLLYAFGLIHLAVTEILFGPWGARSSYVAFLCGWGLLSFVEILIWYAAASHTVDGRRWKTLFVIVSSSYGIRMLLCLLDVLSNSNWTYHASPVFSVILCVVLLIVVAWDGRRGRSRDWLHWAGVATACGLSLNSLMTIVRRFAA